jgi:hypothetical protein
MFSKAEEFDASSVSFDRDQTINLAKGDLNFFGGICIPEIFKYFFPAIFIAIFQLLVEAVTQERGILRLCIGLPRGFAKTAFLKLYVAWVILFTDRQFILVVCNTEGLAMNFLSDVFDILSSPNIKALFGDWSLGIEKDTQSLKKFGFRGRDIIVAGIGVGTSLRGLNLKFRRPDTVIMDDMQSREDAENPKTANDQLIWLLGTLMKARNYERCLFIFVGNMYPFDGSILRKLKYNKQWISFIAGGILADGESLWPEFRPVEELLAELEHDISMGHPEVFYSEVLNDEEAGTVSGLDISRIPVLPESHLQSEPQGGFILIDPASGKRTGNDVAIGAFLILNGAPVFREIVADKFNPMATIHESLKLAMKYGITLIAVESNAYQATLLFWFDWVCRQLGLSGFNFVELTATGIAKNTKIKAALNSLISEQTTKDRLTKYAQIWLHPDVRSKVLHQITQWNPLRQHNEDDLLDLLAWVHPCIATYSHFMEITGSIAMETLLESLSDMRGQAIPAATTLEEIGATF